MIGQQLIMRDILPLICWFWPLLSWSCCTRVLEAIYCPVSFSLGPSGCLYFLLVRSSSCHDLIGWSVSNWFWLIWALRKNPGLIGQHCSLGQCLAVIGGFGCLRLYMCDWLVVFCSGHPLPRSLYTDLCTIPKQLVQQKFSMIVSAEKGHL